MAPEYDPVRVAAILRDVHFQPRHGCRQILDAGRPRALRREPVAQCDADELLADGPETDVVIERSTFRALRAARKTAAVHEHHDGLGSAGNAGRFEHVEDVTLVR